MRPASRPRRRAFDCRWPLGLALLLALALVAPIAAAAESAEELTHFELKEEAGDRYRAALDYDYGYLKPNDVYGDWHGLSFSLYWKTIPRMVPFVQLGLHDRAETRGALTLGTYLDWVPGLYSYSAFTTGGESDHLPRWRFDHSFHMGTGPLFLTLGGGILKDHADHEDWYLAAGPRWWQGLYIAEYLLTRNVSDPGGELSWSHRLALGRGSEGDRWFWLAFTMGDERYQATWVTPPQLIENDFWEIDLSVQRWLRPGFGYRVRLAYLELGEEPGGYDKIGVGLGLFWED